MSSLLSDQIRIVKPQRFTLPSQSDFKVLLRVPPMNWYKVLQNNCNARITVEGSDVFLSGTILTSSEEVQFKTRYDRKYTFQLQRIKDRAIEGVTVNGVDIIYEDGYHAPAPQLEAYVGDKLLLNFSLPKGWSHNLQPDVPINTTTCGSIQIPVIITTNLESKIHLTLTIKILNAKNSVAGIREWIAANPRPLPDDEDKVTYLNFGEFPWPLDTNFLEMQPQYFKAAIESETCFVQRERLIAAMHHCGVSEADLAEKLGGRNKKSAEISRYCTGVRPIPAKKISMLAGVLGIEPDWLKSGLHASAPDWLKPYCASVQSILLAFTWAEQNGLALKPCPPGFHPRSSVRISTPSEWVRKFIYRLDSYLRQLPQANVENWLTSHGHLVEALPYIPMITQALYHSQIGGKIKEECQDSIADLIQSICASRV